MSANLLFSPSWLRQLRKKMASSPPFHLRHLVQRRKHQRQSVQEKLRRCLLVPALFMFLSIRTCSCLQEIAVPWQVTVCFRGCWMPIFLLCHSQLRTYLSLDLLMVRYTSSPTSVSGNHCCIIYINDIYTSKNEVRGSASQRDFNYNLKKSLGELTISIWFKKTNLRSEILSVLRIEGKNYRDMLKSLWGMWYWGQ